MVRDGFLEETDSATSPTQRNSHVLTCSSKLGFEGRFPNLRKQKEEQSTVIHPKKRLELNSRVSQVVINCFQLIIFQEANSQSRLTRREAWQVDSHL